MVATIATQSGPQMVTQIDYGCGKYAVTRHRSALIRSLAYENVYRSGFAPKLS